MGNDRLSLPNFLVVLRALTPVHAGVGSEAVSPIDLPIQREKHTEWPTIYGSSIKGALRAYVRRIHDGGIEKAIFGAGTEDSEKFPGLYTFSDARLLLFPVRSYSHVYLYVTCPLALRRLEEDMRIVGISANSGNSITWNEIPDPVYVLDQKLEVKEAKFSDLTVYFEKEPKNESNKSTESNDKAEKLLQILYQILSKENLKETLNGRIVVLDDLKFTEIVRTQTMVVPRVKLGPLKTTEQGGNLWYEEYLPPETIMYFLAIPLPLSEEERIEVLKKASKREEEKGESRSPSNGESQGESEENLQELISDINEKLEKEELFSGTTPLGGKETIGKGLISLIPIRGKSNGNK